MSEIGHALERVMEITPDMRHQAALDEHQRDTRREILLPAAIGLGVLILAVLSAAFISTRYEELRLVSNFVLMLLILCPAALCVFPLAIILVVAAVGMNNVHDWSQVKLGALNRVSSSLNRRIDGVTARLGRAGVDIGAATAPLDTKVFSAFDRLPRTAVNEGKHEPSSKRSSDTAAKTGRGPGMES